MVVGKGWGKGTGDALPSAPQQQPALARAEGSSTGLQSWMERVYGRAVNLLVTTLPPASRSVGAQPVAVAAPGCGPGGGFDPSPGWSGHPQPEWVPKSSWQVRRCGGRCKEVSAGVLPGEERRNHLLARVHPDASTEEWIRRRNCFPWLCYGISASSFSAG